MQDHCSGKPSEAARSATIPGLGIDLDVRVGQEHLEEFKIIFSLISQVKWSLTTTIFEIDPNVRVSQE